ncbi:MAG: YigZ family protein [Bacteroidales bacterium]|nr:YigZ family protein [Bacteroidales bacterium]
MEDTYRTIIGSSEGLYKEKGSKFLAFAYHVESEEEVKARLGELRKKYYDARHHCYAYALGPKKSAFRMNDDGEPSGTGGKPIYGQLLSMDVTDTLIVVVRYFGGVLLGTSGLTNAYKTAAREALESATIEERTVDDRYRVGFKYEQMNDVMRIVKDFGLTLTKQRFEMECEVEFSVRQSNSERVRQAFENLRTVNIEKTV